MSLIALLVAIHVMVRPDALESPLGRLLRFGALERERVFGAGDWWRLITAALLHHDIGHLIGNCVGILVLGAAVVSAVGWRRFAGAALVSGIVGNLAQLWMGNPRAVTVGASGIVFGLLGLLVVLRLRQIRSDPTVLPKREHLRLIGFGVLALLGTGRPGKTAWMAHAGGFAAGALMAPRPKKRPRLELVEDEHLRWN